MKFQIPILMLAGFILLYGCSKTASITTTSERYKDVAINKFKDGYNFYPSGNKKYVLCTKEIEGTAINPANHIDFFVYDVEEEIIVLEKSVDNGKVKWFSDFQIEVLAIPGIMAQGQTLDDYTKVYNLESGAVKTKSEFTNKKRN